MKWKPTAEDNRITARRLAGDRWSDCTFPELRPGDIVRMVDPRGDVIHPYTLELNEECVSLVKAPPKKMNLADGDPSGIGYGVEIETYSTMVDLRAKGLS